MQCARRAAAIGIAVGMLAVCTARPAAAQVLEGDRFVPPIAGGWEPVQSIGQPARWQPFIGFGFGVDEAARAPQVGATGSIGVFRPILNPLFGLGTSAQVYFGQRGELVDAGGRVYGSLPAFFIHAGMDYNARLNRTDLILSAEAPTVRGGWFRRGGQMRIDWIPGRGHSLVIGATVPVAQPLAGRTRPRRVDVPLPQPPAVRRLGPPPAGTPVREAIEEVRNSLSWISTLHHVFWASDARGFSRLAALEHTRRVLGGLRQQMVVRDTLLPGRNTYEREVQYYHDTLDRAFALAVGARSADAHAGDDARAGTTDDDARATRDNDAGWNDGVGRVLSERARRIALTEVVLPYNRTVGQYKKPDELDGLIARARARFVAVLALDDALDEAAVHTSLQVFDTWLGSFEQLRASLDAVTNDSRMHWLPLAFVLRAEEHETQGQIDGLVDVALGRGFTGGNATLYINAPQFQWELIRTIHEAEVYHVLWIHDFRGRNELGEPDGIGFHQAVNGYMRAMLHRIRRYDDTGTLPVFILMLDQHSYDIYDSRVWLDLLERPLTHAFRLPPRLAEVQRSIEVLQDSLRAAIAASRRLSAEVAAFGPEWITDVVKVHVNVTNPSDLSFRTSRLLGLPIGADNLMRDHRKIVVRDVTEADPGAGEVILTGVGVGEKYTSARWEDRGMILQGPAALEAKNRARATLERHGLRGDALPRPLRPLPFALDYAERVRALQAEGATARALQAHNRTGFGDKEATFVQMLLYDLAPAGTVIYVPDSLWANYEWLAQLVSAALRGCHVFVVAPAAAHAPSSGFPQMSVMQELVSRLVIVQEQLGPVIAAAGGELHVGLYTRASAIDHLPARLDEVVRNFDRFPFLHDLFTLDDAAWAVVRGFRDAPAPEVELAEDVRGRPPQMHRKTQLIASRELLAALGRSPGMREVLPGLLRAETESLALPAESGRLTGQQRIAPSGELLELFRRLPPELQLAAPVYFAVGSLNKDVRSMALDGEVLAVVAGEWALQAYLDFLLLSGAVTWVTSLEEVDALLPPHTNLERWIGRLLLRQL
jgi:hypothetical protein